MQLSRATEVSLPRIVLFTSVLVIPLAAAPDFGRSPAAMPEWIFGIYRIPALRELALALRLRQPVLMM